MKNYFYILLFFGVLPFQSLARNAEMENLLDGICYLFSTRIGDQKLAHMDQWEIRATFYPNLEGWKSNLEDLQGQCQVIFRRGIMDPGNPLQTHGMTIHVVKIFTDKAEAENIHGLSTPIPAIVYDGENYRLKTTTDGENHPTYYVAAKNLEFLFNIQ